MSDNNKIISCKVYVCNRMLTSDATEKHVSRDHSDALISIKKLKEQNTDDTIRLRCNLEPSYYECSE